MTKKETEAGVRVVTVDDVPDIRVNRNWCKGCGICIQVCPMDVYAADKDGKPILIQPEVCIWCEKCETYCPDFAISLIGKRGW
ncbi:MAG TPA: 4Fe-4S dicluster domain-containing protein [Symbiobacteriaceae bacterium]|nr:4Fe-4S dicluster domain-containing protein [Symbiobacteriaceae bacterium]